MPVEGFAHFGGKHSESATLKNLLAHAGAINPCTGQPFSEALCFGIAGGIGAGYLFCPSVVCNGKGSGVSVIGRHRAFATDATWYQGFCDRLGIQTRQTETAAKGKAAQNLAAEIEAGRPAVVWCAGARLPFLGSIFAGHCLAMHSFLVFALDEERGEAHGSDRAATGVSLSLDELAEARAGVCSHKNRTLTIEAPGKIPAETVRAGLRAGLQACAAEMLAPKIKTFGLPGLATWPKALVNRTGKDGWARTFPGSLLYWALRDLYESIQTDTGGGLFRLLFAACLEEASGLLKSPALGELACTYRELGGQWIRLAEAALPKEVKVLKQTRELLDKRNQLIEEQGRKAVRQITATVEKLRKLDVEVREDFPLNEGQAAELLDHLGGQAEALYEAEQRAALELQKV